MKIEDIGLVTGLLRDLKRTQEKLNVMRVTESILIKFNTVDDSEVMYFSGSPVASGSDFNVSMIREKLMDILEAEVATITIRLANHGVTVSGD